MMSFPTTPKVTYTHAVSNRQLTKNNSLIKIIVFVLCNQNVSRIPGKITTTKNGREQPKLPSQQATLYENCYTLSIGCRRHHHHFLLNIANLNDWIIGNFPQHNIHCHLQWVSVVRHSTWELYNTTSVFFSYPAGEHFMKMTTFQTSFMCPLEGWYRNRKRQTTQVRNYCFLFL